MRRAPLRSGALGVDMEAVCRSRGTPLVVSADQPAAVTVTFAVPLTVAWLICMTVTV